jgi:S1-C subfamily serine protease
MSSGRGRLSAAIAMLALALAGLGGCATGARTPTRGQIVQRILPSSVQVVLEEEGRRVRTGSGVVIAFRPDASGDNCFVLTSGHTFGRLSGKESVHVLLDRHQGAGVRVPAAVLAQRDADGIDLALLGMRSERCLAARLGSAPALGDDIWVVAFPWGRNLTLVSGIVSQVNLEPTDHLESASRLMVDASVSYGASGGGVFEASTGRLVGLIEGYRTARVSFKGETASRYIDVPVPGETYVVPLADIRQFLTESGHSALLGDASTVATPRR